ncbi:MAG: short chain dehydrogenase [Pseudomonadota bacterium]
MFQRKGIADGTFAVRGLVLTGVIPFTEYPPMKNQLDWQLLDDIAKHGQHLQRGLVKYSRDWLGSTQAVEQPQMNTPHLHTNDAPAVGHASAVLTGAGGGMGTACARTLASQGWHVVCIDHNGPALTKLQSQLGQQCTPLCLPVQHPDLISETLQHLTNAPPVQALVNMVGLARWHSGHSATSGMGAGLCCERHPRHAADTGPWTPYAATAEGQHRQCGFTRWSCGCTKASICRQQGCLAWAHHECSPCARTRCR